MNIQSKIDNLSKGVKSKYFQVSQELEQIIKQVNQEIEDTYERCKNNKKFNKFDSYSKRKWYYERLEERIKQNVYVKYSFRLFDNISKVANIIIQPVIKENIKQFTDIRNIKLGDKDGIEIKAEEVKKY